LGVERLDGWKAIATFLNRDERTVRRWEATRGLPVHRIPGGERPRIWADPAELRDWLARGGAEEETVALPPTRTRWRLMLVGAALVASVPIGVAAWLAREPAVAVPYRDDQARELYLRGVFLWNGRTPQGIAEATRIFQRLAADHPRQPEAFAKLADCYLLQREFGTLPEPTAYARARAAAHAALKRDPRSPGGLRALAFVRFWHDADPAALDLFAQAAALDPRSAQTQLWYANALSTRARHAEAQAAFAKARALDPNNSAIIADQAFDLLFSGRTEEAERLIRAVLAVQPGLSSAHRALAWASLRRGDDLTFLAEAREAARLRGDRIAIAELSEAEAALAAGGRGAMLQSLASAKEAQQRRTGYGHVEAAFLHAAAGDRRGVQLALAQASRTPEAISLPVARSYANVR